MGCVPGDKDCNEDDQATHLETVAPFWMGRTTVTVAAYAACIKAGACSTALNDDSSCNGPEKPTHPANCLNLNQATAFCTWMGGRLPTEAEWEFVAKGGEENRPHPWGKAPVDARHANYCDKHCPEALNFVDRKNFEKAGLIDHQADDGFAATAPVGSFSKGDSRWGLHDLCGNVWQWTTTLFDDRHYIVKGGSWHSPPLYLRGSNRSLQYEASVHLPDLGFRCVQ